MQERQHFVHLCPLIPLICLWRHVLLNSNRLQFRISCRILGYLEYYTIILTLSTFSNWCNGFCTSLWSSLFIHFSSTFCSRLQSLLIFSPICQKYSLLLSVKDHSPLKSDNRQTERLIEMKSIRNTLKISQNLNFQVPRKLLVWFWKKACHTCKWWKILKFDKHLLQDLWS